jgi:hypothetical protein
MAMSLPSSLTAETAAEKINPLLSAVSAYLSALLDSFNSEDRTLTDLHRIAL